MTQLNVYPNLEELMPEPLMNMLPVNLARDIAERYINLGTKYLSDQVHADGRRINAMMFTSRIVNCLEEIIDSVFCVLGQIFKETVDGEEPADYLFDVLSGLINLYGLLKTHEEEDLARCEGVVNL